MEKTQKETATLAGGCFWCTEAIFQRLKGVASVIPGYTGGTVENPTYEAVCSGTTGHAEAIRITFDPAQISYETLLEVFFALHDSTTLNRQDNDVGTQYRSVIFYHSDDLKRISEKIKNTISKSTTEITSFTNFYKAEDYHQNFYNNNAPNQYCMYVIDPKIKKLMSEFKAIVN